MMPERLFGPDLSLPQKLRARTAIGLARLAVFGLRRLGRGATALPGKIALRVDPNLLQRLTAKRLVYLVTGTNGKTTTVRILCSILRETGHAVITNPSGANLDTGLTTTLIQALPLLQAKGAKQKPLALVFEIDEAYFAKFSHSLNPTVCVVTNFFRDQLDRFGELGHTRDLIARGLAQTEAIAVLCADDPLCASLQTQEQKALFFGMDRASMLGETRGGQEATHCLFCGDLYEYEALAYGHLGFYRCPGCGFSRPDPDLEFTVQAARPQHLDLRFCWQQQEAATRLSIPGIHNGYNAAAALLAALASDLPLLPTAAALSHAKAAFGRMERFPVGDKEICLILVKNPVGMDRGLEFVRQAQDRGGVMFLLNANDPDGRDVSWIWDADFENGLPPGDVGVSGVRCHDMALRLRYAGRDPAKIQVDSDAIALFDRLLAQCAAGRCLYVLPNYTAMLDLRRELARRYDLPEFWR